MDGERRSGGFGGGGRSGGFGGNRGGGRFGGGGRSFGGGNRGGGFRRSFNDGPREMHKAICSDCKKECEVPFKPTEGKPVYCRECFFKRKDSADGNGTAMPQHSNKSEASTEKKVAKSEDAEVSEEAMDETEEDSEEF